MIRAVRPPASVLRVIWSAQKASDLMTPSLATVSLDATVGDAARILTANNLHATPVVNDLRRPVGSISRIDIILYAGRSPGIRAVSELFDVDSLVSWSSSNHLVPIIPDLPERMNVRNVMDRRIRCVQRDAPVAHVVRELLDQNEERLFVVDDDGALIGEVSAHDVLRNLRR